MNSRTFERLFKEQNQRSENILCGKAKEYAMDDERLHNFKIAAALQGLTPIQALAGMMAKHTISIYDMCWSEEEYPIELWAEKITDHINYLHLLNALVREKEAAGESDFAKALSSHVKKKEQTVKNDMAEMASYAREILDRAANAYYAAAAEKK